MLTKNALLKDPLWADRLSKKYKKNILLSSMDKRDLNELKNLSSKHPHGRLYYRILKFLSYDFPMTKDSRFAVNKLIEIQMDEDHPRKMDTSLAIHLARLSNEHHKEQWKQIVSLVDTKFQKRNRNVYLKADERIDYLLRSRAYEELSRRRAEYTNNKINKKQIASIFISEARARFRSGDYRKSIEVFEDFLEEFPTSHKRHFVKISIADAYKNLKEFSKAQQIYSRVLSIRLFQDMPAGSLFWMLYKMGEYDRAIKIIEKNPSISKIKLLVEEGSFGSLRLMRRWEILNPLEQFKQKS